MAKTLEKIKKKGNRRGSSMVEVLVAFVIVLVTVLSFMKVVRVSSRFLVRSQNAVEAYEMLNEDYYKKDSPRTLLSDQFSLCASEDGTLLQLEGAGLLVYQDENGTLYTFEAAR